jgi:hypothetical protein
MTHQLNFPIIIVDDFYENFNEIKVNMNKFNFYQKNNASMPGLETKFLREIDSDFNDYSIKKLLSIIYDNNILNNIKYECRSKFCKIVPYGEKYNNDGWIHFDDDNVLSALLYLEGEYSEGTSFYKKKNTNLIYDFKEKHDLYNGFKPKELDYNEKLKKHNDQFEEILNVPLIPNRLIIFDSSLFHKSNGLGSHEKPRIIQTFFFGNIEKDSFPLSKINRIQ